MHSSSCHNYIYIYIYILFVYPHSRQENTTILVIIDISSHEESVHEVAPHNTCQLNCINSHNGYKYLITRSSMSKIIKLHAHSLYKIIETKKYIKYFNLN
jgi:hypothetical protein